MSTLSTRTLAAHRYDNEADELSMNEQLLDSCTIAPSSLPGRVAGHVATGVRSLVAPVGLRYHALHHWIPSLPYHNLARAHRLLLSTLGADTPYVATQYPAIAPIVIDLVHRARRHAP